MEFIAGEFNRQQNVVSAESTRFPSPVHVLFALCKSLKALKL